MRRNDLIGLIGVLVIVVASLDFLVVSPYNLYESLLFIVIVTGVTILTSIAQREEN